jgi:hypothetical protein
MLRAASREAQELGAGTIAREAGERLAEVALTERAV